jgi:hypothetical protein
VKLVGDLYLTKIYARTADRLHLGEWQRSIDGKLELVQKIADVLSGRARPRGPSCSSSRSFS